jgi:hypothetical protein
MINTLVPAEIKVPSYVLYGGIPGRVVKVLEDTDVNQKE